METATHRAAVYPAPEPRLRVARNAFALIAISVFDYAIRPLWSLSAFAAIGPPSKFDYVREHPPGQYRAGKGCPFFRDRLNVESLARPAVTASLGQCPLWLAR